MTKDQTLIKPTYKIPTINDVVIIPSCGPWKTKSNGQLNVLFGIEFTKINDNFFKYEESELNTIPIDIRGLRAYDVSALSKGSVGANEWHRVRNELIFIINGSIKLTCIDTLGNQKEFILDKTNGAWIPPFIMHTYESQQNSTELLVVANTLFLPDEPKTHDSFDLESFKKIQKKFKTPQLD